MHRALARRGKARDLLHLSSSSSLIFPLCSIIPPFYSSSYQSLSLRLATWLGVLLFFHISERFGITSVHTFLLTIPSPSAQPGVSDLINFPSPWSKYLSEVTYVRKGLACSWFQRDFSWRWVEWAWWWESSAADLHTEADKRTQTGKRGGHILRGPCLVTYFLQVDPMSSKILSWRGCTPDSRTNKVLISDKGHICSFSSFLCALCEIWSEGDEK